MVKGYFMMYLLLHVGMMGVFCALDFFLFYVFWEVMLLPMYFLVGIWGGERKEYAAIKFFLYTLFGGALMLLGIIALYMYSKGPGGMGVPTFSIIELASRDWTQYTVNIFGWQLPFDKTVWWLLFVGFAIKVPIFPFHTWLPWAHVQAPTAVSVVLAGVLLKMGTYGLLRVNFSILPEATQAFSYMLVILGIVNIHLRSPLRHGADRPQKTRGLQFGESHGVLHFGYGGLQAGCDGGRRSSDVQPRALGRDDVYARRRAL
jgi:NADH-quinone oxidoreductase subunit M